MSSLTLDGSNRIVGTEFVKIEITGSSNLATEQFVNEAVAGGGGNVDLTNYYNKTEVDGFLDAKLSLSGEASQTIAGSVNITNNLTTATNIQCNNIVSSNAYSNTFYNKDSNVNTTFAYDATPWMVYNNSSAKIELKPTVECENNIYTNELSNLTLDTDLIIKQDGVAYIQLEKGKDEVRAYKKVRCPEIITNGFNTGINFDDVVFKHNDITYLSFDYDTDTIVFSKPTNLVLGGGGVDYDLVVGSSLTVLGVRNGTNVLTVNGTSYLDGAVNCNGGVYSNAYHSVSNANLDFYRNNILHLTFNTANELVFPRRANFNDTTLFNAGIWADSINTVSVGNMTFNRAGSLFMTFNTSNQVLIEKETVCKDVLKSNVISTYTDTDLNIQRNGTTYINLSNTNDRVEMFKYLNVALDGTQMILTNPTGGNYIVHSLGNHISAFASGGLPNVLHLNYYSGGDIFLGHQGGAPTITVNKWSSNTGKSFEVAGVSEFSGGELIAGGGINTNRINTDGDADMNIQRNGNTYINLNTASDRIDFYKNIFGNGNFSLGGLSGSGIYYSDEGETYKIMDIRNNTVSGATIRFICGSQSATNIIFQLNQTNAYCGRNLAIDPSYKLSTNVIDTYDANDLVFYRSTVEYFRLDGANSLLNVASGVGISSSIVYGNYFKSRTNNTDTIWEGAVNGGTRKEIFRFNYLGDSLDFNTTIDNTGLGVIGNIVDTTVSDEKLKENINDVECDASMVVKNINVKTFNYKDKKYGVGEQFGFIADELQRELPKEFSKIVGNDKEGNLNMNFIKLSAVLWKALQEQIVKTEYLEARLFEVENLVQHPKRKPKSKAKAKSKD